MTETRYLFMPMPGAANLDVMQTAIEREGMDQLLSRALFPPAHWHQSLSDLYWQRDIPDLEE